MSTVTSEDDLSWHRDLPSGAVIYIDAPTYVSNSNGIRCLYCLGQELAGLGYVVAYVPRRGREFWKQLPDEFRAYRVVPLWEMATPGVLICSESVSAQTVQIARRRRINIVWWYLAPHALLGRPKAVPRPSEVILPFSPYVMLNCRRYYFYQPPPDVAWSQALSIHRPRTDHIRPCIAIYTGKGRLARLSGQLQSFLFGATVIPITRDSPSTRDELFEVLRRADGLITFDELSQLTLEAVTLGVPVFLANPLFRQEAAASFPLPIAPFIARQPTHFIELVHLRRTGALKSPKRNQLGLKNAQLMSDLRVIIAKILNSPRAEYGERLVDMASYGRLLRRSRVLYPQYNGQPASSWLLGVYIMSIQETRFIHLSLCEFAWILDEIGRLAFALGFEALFTRLFKRSLIGPIAERAGTMVLVVKQAIIKSEDAALEPAAQAEITKLIRANQVQACSSLAERLEERSSVPSRK